MDASAKEPPDAKRPSRNGTLRIPLPFEEAVKAALEVRPEGQEKTNRKKRKKDAPKAKPNRAERSR